MPITVRCGCDWAFEVDDGQAGHDVTCEGCRRSLSIPTPTEVGRKLIEVKFNPAEGTAGESLTATELREVFEPADSLPPLAEGLVRCGACRQGVAVEAETCPHCGGDLPRKRFNTGTPYVQCGQCLATNSFLEGYGGTEKCRACGASLEVPYRERERVLRIWNELWWLCLLGVAFGGFVGYFMGSGAGGAVTGGFLAGMVGGWVGYIRYWLLTKIS
jgi:hypothetical protein